MIFFSVLILFFPKAHDSYGKTGKILRKRDDINPIHMVVVFSKFKGEASGDSLAPEWAEYLFDGNPGSVNHYYNEISFGQITITGKYLPKRYELPRVSSYYSNNLDEYTRDLLDAVDNDETVDFSMFDNDGPDGIPGSEDDDGYVDFIVLMPMSRPIDFIVGSADGIAELRLQGNYYTSDKNSLDEHIKIGNNSGTITTAPNLNQAIGLICHEYCHYYGTWDLYDTDHDSFETDSAGIGNWGLMSWGLLGWNGTDGPVVPNAFTRMIMGCIGINNSSLVDLYGIHKDVRISDVNLENGRVYRIWVSEKEYFLIEYRRSDGSYYDRNIPQNGILIWHIVEKYSNNNELLKRCDLECADGRYSDAGYPLGMAEDPLQGGDNLDFWAHDNGYASEHAGNLGDATDVYDGITFTIFGPDTNPNSHSKVTGKYTGIKIFNIHTDGNDMVFDVSIPPFSEWISYQFPLIGTAFHRFRDIHNPEEPLQKETTLYLLNYGRSSHADELVTVYQDSLTVDDLSQLDHIEVQRALEQRIFMNSQPLLNAKIIRENISYATFIDEITNLGITPGEFGSGDTFHWIQKISVTGEKEPLPETIELSQNYPNPFNSRTTITYILPASVSVTLEVFNVLGQKVRVIDHGMQEAGRHTLQFDGEDLSSGIYFYRIRGSMTSPAKKLLLIR